MKYENFKGAYPVKARTHSLKIDNINATIIACVVCFLKKKIWERTKINFYCFSGFLKYLFSFCEWTKKITKSMKYHKGRRSYYVSRVHLKLSQQEQQPQVKARTHSLKIDNINATTIACVLCFLKNKH